MRLIQNLLATAVIAAFSATQLHASPLLFEGFETYQVGALDADYPQGPNHRTNNPWFGYVPENLHVTGAEMNQGVLVTPHSGSYMVRGSLRPGDSDQDFYNLTYWLNSSNGHTAFTGNLSLDWWFYDPIGAGTNASNFQDFLALGFYPGIPTNSPYDPAAATTFGVNGNASQIMSLGATTWFTGNPPPGDADVTVYQARLLNAASGDGYGQGWRNLTKARTIGWHHARWIILPQLADQSNDIVGYLDDMVNPVIQDNVVSPNGYNSIEMDDNFGPDGSITAYYDDITMDYLPAPKLDVVNAGNGVVLNWQNGWILQSTTNLLNASTFKDVPSSNTNLVHATSPYTNSVTGTNQLYFRLRN
jgi:hypothetical protein